MRRIVILFEDESCLVLDKPHGLAVQGGVGVGNSVDSLLKAQFCDSGAKTFLVHRLDKDTSGVLLVAKSKDAARYYTELFASRAVKKIYTALCAEAGFTERSVLPPQGSIDSAIFVRGEKKTARTLYTTKECGAFGDFLRWRRFELELDTGRMHQIRRHLAGAGYPILGDDKYGDFSLNKIIKKTLGIRRLLLHASAISFTLFCGTNIKIESPPPKEFSIKDAPFAHV